MPDSEVKILGDLNVARLGVEGGIRAGLEIFPVNGFSNIFSIEGNLRRLKERLSNSKKIALVISGPAAAGKDSLIDGLTRKYGGTFERVQTCTTRMEQRLDERENDPYVRMSMAEFEAAVKRNEFLEYVPYAGVKVGTNRKVVEETLNRTSESGKIPVFRIDPKGAKTILDLCNEGDPLFRDYAVIYINVVPESWWQIARRLLARDYYSKPEKVRGRAEGYRWDMGSTNSSHEEDKPTLGEKVRNRWDQIKKDVSLMDVAHFVLINKKGALAESIETVVQLVNSLT